MPPPAISARKKSLQFLSLGGVRPRERRTPSATVARNHREDKLAAPQYGSLCDGACARSAGGVADGVDLDGAAWEEAVIRACKASGVEVPEFVRLGFISNGHRTAAG
jgi:hypothetical protein